MYLRFILCWLLLIGIECQSPAQVKSTPAKTVHQKRPANLSDSALLDLVQQQTFHYFWDFAHPVSGLSRERSNKDIEYGDEVVTTGGTGFGIMALIVATERKWITRDSAAHSPTNDNGTITPTAALSAFPYTPEYSMQALRYFYDDLGDKIWSEYGFVDAFNESRNWTAKSHLAIDQGPIIVMIENYRSGLLWKLFMSNPEIHAGLKKLGFESPYINH